MEQKELRIDVNYKYEISSFTCINKDIVELDDVEVSLYCDSVNLKQQYMAPYYVLTGKDKSGAKVSLTMPAGMSFISGEE